MSNFIRTSSLLLVLCCVGVGVAQEKQGQKKKQAEPSATGAIVAPLPAEHDPASWKEYKSDAGGFRIKFPGTPREETTLSRSTAREIPLHFLRFKGLAHYAVMYADTTAALGLNPEATLNLLDSAVKKAVAMFQATALQRKKITLDGYPGISQVMRMPDGLVLPFRVYVVRDRLYQLVVLPPPEQGATGEQRRFYEATAKEFFDSFKLTPLAPLPVVDVSAGADSAPPAPKKLPRAPISGGILNGKAVSKPNPAYPAAAKQAGVSGMVEVAIVIDEEGRVSEAEALSGPVELRAAAVEAARRARFPPTRLSGQPVKISGRLTYNFVLR